MLLLTLVNVLLALVPRAVMAVMQTTIMRASITAYSTAVGPSSRRRKFTIRCANFVMTLLLLRESLELREKTPASRTHYGIQGHVVESFVRIAAEGGNGGNAN